MSRFKKLLLGAVILYSIGIGFIIVDFNAINPAGPLSKAQIADIYRDVVKASGEVGRAPTLEIVDSPTINAYASDAGIVIFTGLTDISNANSIALILGHELGHYLLGHTSENISHGPDDVQRMELQADKYGAFLAIKAGYDVCDGRVMFKNLTKMFGDDMTMDHPSNAFRYDQLNVSCD